MKINWWKPIEWVSERVGFRPAWNYEANTRSHNLHKKISAIWFEFIKRLTILAALNLGAQKAAILWPVYFLSLALLVIPIGTWLERWDLDFLTRKPTHYRPEFDGVITTPISPDKPPAWAYSLPIGVVGSLVFGLGINVALNFIVIRLSEAMAGIK